MVLHYDYSLVYSLKKPHFCLIFLHFLFKNQHFCLFTPSVFTENLTGAAISDH